MTQRPTSKTQARVIAATPSHASKNLLPAAILIIAAAIFLIATLLASTLNAQTIAPDPDPAAAPDAVPGLNPANQSRSEAPPIAVLSAADLQLLAETGRFNQLLDNLKQPSEHITNLGIAPAPGLIEDLERHIIHKNKRLADQADEHKKNIEKMNAYAEAGLLESALRHAIDAHGLAPDPADFIESDIVRSLVDQTLANANEAADDGRWLDTMSYYRFLDLLYEQSRSPYADALDDAQRQVRLLRLYAPQKLTQLHDARELRRIANRKKAKELGLLDEKKKKHIAPPAPATPADPAADGEAPKDGEDSKDPEADSDRDPDKPQPLVLGEETWQDKLEDISELMLEESLRAAYLKHVSGPAYTDLLTGLIDALLVMTENTELAETFPAFSQPETVKRFGDRLVSLRHSVIERGEQNNFHDAQNLVLHVRLANDQTLKLPSNVLIYEMTDGALSALDDFTAVIWPHDKEQFARNTQGKFYGVGIQISRRKNRLIVVSPLEDTPAAKAGIKAQDVIATVDDRPTDSWTLDQAVRKITGPEGTVVNLGIERAGEPDLLIFPLKRAEIEIRSIRGWRHLPGGGWDYYIDRDNKIGYVRLSQFIPNSARKLDEAVRKMQKDAGLNALILDLRFNPGGLLTSAIEISDRFIEKGRIVSTVGPLGQRSTARAHSLRTYKPFPVVVLINQGSASASEIVAGALQDYGRATIVGTRSFGKGSVQDLLGIDHKKAYLKLTTQHYQLPNGRIIHRTPDATRWGIDPDLEVTVTDEQVIELLEFRTAVDVLRDAKEADDANDAENDEPELDENGRVLDVDTILTDSLDPQLEVALLLLKTRLTADRVASIEK